jgi:hypothetical protein
MCVALRDACYAWCCRTVMVVVVLQLVLRSPEVVSCRQTLCARLGTVGGGRGLSLVSLRHGHNHLL